jgi:hypothetical protein
MYFRVGWRAGVFFKASDAKLNTAQLPHSHADATGKLTGQAEVLDRSSRSDFRVFAGRIY